MIRRVVAGVSGVVVVAAVVSGCTGPAAEPSPSSTPSVTESATPSPTPTLTEEERLLAMIPDAAKGDDLPAAVEMAKFFITLHPGLFMGEDPALFEFLSLPECVFCSSSVSSARNQLARGEMQVGGDLTVADGVAESVLDLETDTALVGFDVTEAAYQVRDSEGALISEREAKGLKFALALELVNGVWRVAGVDIESA